MLRGRPRGEPYLGGGPLVFFAPRVAIEISTGQPGHPSTYGLLGADWFPETSGPFHAQIHIRESAAPFRPSLEDYDDALVGIPAEYCDGMIRGLQNSAVPSGSLIVRYGAHSPVGSSPFLFCWLSRALVRLFALPPSDRNIDIVGSMIAQCRPWYRSSGPMAFVVNNGA